MKNYQIIPENFPFQTVIVILIILAGVLLAASIFIYHKKPHFKNFVTGLTFWSAIPIFFACNFDNMYQERMLMAQGIYPHLLVNDNASVLIFFILSLFMFVGGLASMARTTS